MKNQKLFIGIPAYGPAENEFRDALEAFVKAYDVETVLWARGDSLVCRARNFLAAKFLQSDCTHFLQLNTDLEFDPTKLWEMVWRNESVVAGLYALKRPGPVTWCLNKQASKEKPGELVAVDTAGTGMLRVKRSVLQKIIHRKLANEYQSDDGEPDISRRWDLFPVGVVDGRYMSEDWGFCRLAEKVGERIWVDPNCFAGDWGRASYPIQVSE